MTTSLHAARRRRQSQQLAAAAALLDRITRFVKASRHRMPLRLALRVYLATGSDEWAGATDAQRAAMVHALERRLRRARRRVPENGTQRARRPRACHPSKQR